jgi:hypothetical protein
VLCGRLERQLGIWLNRKAVADGEVAMDPSSSSKLVAASKFILPAKASREKCAVVRVSKRCRGKRLNFFARWFS